MLIQYDPAGTPEALSAMLAAVAAADGVGLVVVLACEANGFTPERIDSRLATVAPPLVGGIFPQILMGGDRLERGTVVAGLRCRASVACVPAVSEAATDFEGIVGSAFPTGARGGTLLLFVDGLASRIGSLVESLFNVFGLEIDYIGGGAGSLTLRRMPCVMTNRGLFADAAVLALTDIGAGIGVAHGWTSIGGVFKVTEADRNTVASLDWRPAFEVYRETVEVHSGRRFAGRPFFELAKEYPFGIARLDAEMVVRDPIMARGSALVCVGEVPRGAYIHILHGSRSSLVAAAAQARRLSRGAYRGHPGTASLFFIDCISRVLFLGADFGDELSAVADGGLPLIGALTLGEIANSGRDFIEFFNKTAVVGLMDA